MAGGFTQNVSTFTDYGAEQRANDRQRRMAEMMQQQSAAPIETGMAGGAPVPISWTQGLAKMLQAYNGRVGAEQADVRDKELVGRARTEAADWLRGMPQQRTQDLNLVAGDDDGNAMPPAMRTTQPSRQEMLAWAMQGAAGGNPMAAQMAGPMLAQYMKPEEDYTLGEGQRRFRGGQEIAAGGPRTFAPQKPPDKWGEPYDLNGVLVQKNEVDGQVRTAVSREPVTRITNNNPAPVTPVTIQDPKDQNKTIIVDGRTGAKIGDGPKLTEAGKLEVNRQFNMQGIGKTIEEAERLLSGAETGTQPTQSGTGAAVDWMGRLVGKSPKGAKEAATLEAVGGALTAKMPRMEGPQSDKDTVMYREMAGKVSDRTVPIAERQLALTKVKELWSKYERLNPEAFASGAAATPATGLPDASAIAAEIERRRKARNGS